MAEKLRSLEEKSPGVPMGSMDSKLRRKDQVGICVQMHQRLLADLQAKQIFLVDRNRTSMMAGSTTCMKGTPGRT